MNSMQKQYHAFIESECTRLGCKDVIKPLQEGFAAMCESIDEDDYDSFGGHDYDSFSGHDSIADAPMGRRCQCCGRFIPEGDVPLDKDGFCEECHRRISGEYAGDEMFGASGDDLL